MTNQSVTSTMIEARAYAKINLTLAVKGKRADGFHELDSVVIGVDLHDTVRVQASEAEDMTVCCSDSTIHSSQNLALIATMRLARKVKVSFGVQIDLQKRIPIGGGMGGGSSDAATVLRLCNQLWDAGLDEASLADIGASIGSDVPLFFSLPTARVMGRGEHVESATLRWSGWVLLVFVGHMVPTVDVYTAYRASDSLVRKSDVISDILNASTAATLSAMLYNDLESAVIRLAPEVGRVRQQLESIGMDNFRISGAGSTLFRLYDEQQTAVEAAQQVAHQTGKQTAVVAAPVHAGPFSTKEI